MNSKITYALCALSLLAGALPAAANDKATAYEVVKKVHEASALIRRIGGPALERIAKPASGFVWKDTYVFVVNCEQDVVLVNPAFPDRVGGDIKQHTDYAGKRYGRELCDAALRPAGGWVEYTWLVPGASVPRRKVSFVRTVPGTSIQVGAGIYDDTTSMSELAKLTDGAED